MTGEHIEILSVELLDRHRDLVRDLWRVARATRVEFGWHYLLDLSWIISNLGAFAGSHILDAGAGVGLLQWYLVERGAAQVISTDRGSRAHLPLVLRSRYHVAGMCAADLAPAGDVYRGMIARAVGARKILSAARGLLDLVGAAIPSRFPGRVLIYDHDLVDMPEVPDNSLDAVVALSSLEHNTPECLQAVVAEIMRKLKPGGKLLATLCAGRDADWFHAGSQGWCYHDTTLRRLFDLPQDTPSNYVRYDELFASLRSCAELRHNLAGFYFKSGDNGMPWGKWDPQYQPVGVCKIKPV